MKIVVSYREHGVGKDGTVLVHSPLPFILTVNFQVALDIGPWWFQPSAMPYALMHGLWKFPCSPYADSIPNLKRGFS
jgi:hypothetical protein